MINFGDKNCQNKNASFGSRAASPQGSIILTLIQKQKKTQTTLKIYKAEFQNLKELGVKNIITLAECSVINVFLYALDKQTRQHWI